MDMRRVWDEKEWRRVGTYRISGAHEAIDINGESLLFLLLVFDLLGACHGDGIVVLRIRVDKIGGDGAEKARR